MDMNSVALGLVRAARMLVASSYAYVDEMEPDDRLALVRRPGVAPGLLRKLYLDENQDVRMEVASNPRTPDDVLRKMCDDTSMTVRTRARKTLGSRS